MTTPRGNHAKIALLNLSIRETARHMGLTVANVKVMQSRALKRAAELEVAVTGC